MSVLPDHAAREAALDPAGSFIVQAPAGSGKTGLLIRRFLTLLATVENPEEIVAITFTRKAASEMRDRVLSALLDVDGTDDVAALAARARLRAEERGWQLESNPQRLRMMTIDGFCLALTRQMPWVSGFGAPPGLATDQEPLHREAARETLALIDTGDDAHIEAIRTLLAHFDNQFQSVEDMLVSMLARRDQWADEIVERGSKPRDYLRQELEDTLEKIVLRELRQIHEIFPDYIRNDAVGLARGAGQWFIANEPDHKNVEWFRDLSQITEPPQMQVEDLAVWRHVAKFLLTGSGAFRKARGVTKAIGFPADKSGEHFERKEKMKSLLDELQHEKHLHLATALADVQKMPGATYDEVQWKVVDALTTVLPVALAQLRLSFIRNAEVDFTEVLLRSRQALGDATDPTELALRLDYRIQHLLVDEYQDTSSSQEDLVQRLTAGWAGDGSDGRSLFVVGDPMQSIYRFRKADVGLFVEATRNGIGDIPLSSLELVVNFRSEPGIINWVNEAFTHVMPEDADPMEGAVPLRASQAAPNRGDSEDQGVSFHAFDKTARVEEAEQVVALVDDFLKTTDEDAKLAILVRARSHLDEITPRLRKAGIQFQGKDLEPLGTQPVVQDLLSLTRTILHPADRVAWLSVLRAPWCGLSLADLSALVEHDRTRSILAALQSGTVDGLSPDGRARIDRVLPAFSAAVDQRRRGTLRRAVERLWVAVDGPACTNARGLVDAATLLDLIEQVEAGSDIVDLTELRIEIDGLYASPDLTTDRVQVMTIHHSKGLEFDTVILPGLGRATANDRQQLLSLAEVSVPVESSNGSTELESRVMFSPPSPTGSDADPLYAWLKALDRTRGEFENGRLLYVACTRAERRLHLLGGATHKEDDGWTPAGSSLLNLLWPQVQSAFADLEPPANDDEDEDLVESGPGVPLVRLPSEWSAPVRVESIEAIAEPDVDTAFDAVEFSWAGENARQVGVVVHDVLMKIAEDGLEQWDDERIASERDRWRAALLRNGILDDQLDAAIRRVDKAVQLAMSDEQGRWILDDTHTDAHSEYPLTGVIDGTARQIVIDRTFVDENDVRWIVDYKTGDHGGGEREKFLNEERDRYRPQLERYASVLRKRENREVRVALYYPLMGEFLSWTPESD